LPLGLISFDADRFKTFNDTHGHDAGDAVLRALAGVVRDVLAQGEVCCRVGGEEFAVLLPGRHLAQTHAVALGLCEAVAAMSVRYGEALLPQVTISAGVADYPLSAASAEALVRRADAALYHAKEEGRNRVAGHDGDPDAAPPRHRAPSGPWHEPAPLLPAAAAARMVPTMQPQEVRVDVSLPMSGDPAPPASAAPARAPSSPADHAASDGAEPLRAASVPGPTTMAAPAGSGPGGPPAFLRGALAPTDSGPAPPPRTLSREPGAAGEEPLPSPRPLGADPLPSRGPRPPGGL
jgi:diguanylate cyclase (GGDEF)-like protein